MLVEELLPCVDVGILRYGQENDVLAFVFLAERIEIRGLLDAWAAPCCPEVDKDGFALEVGKLDFLPVGIQSNKVGSGVASGVSALYNSLSSSRGSMEET